MSRDIFHEVIGGRSTTEIADRLFITANTVQDCRCRVKADPLLLGGFKGG